MALHAMMGPKQKLVRYLPLGPHWSLQFAFILPTMFHPFPSLVLPIRSNSERDGTAQRFLQANHKPPTQHLGWFGSIRTNMFCFNTFVQWFHSLRTADDMFKVKCRRFQKKASEKMNQIWLTSVCSTRVLSTTAHCSLFSLGQVGLYAAGIPCTPYSLMGERMLLKDSESKQMWETLRHIRNFLPAVSWPSYQPMCVCQVTFSPKISQIFFRWE